MLRKKRLTMLRTNRELTRKQVRKVKTISSQETIQAARTKQTIKREVMSCE